MAETTARDRTPAGLAPAQVRFGEFELDESNATLLRAGRPLALAPTPFAVLCALARQPGQLLTKHVLLDQVWGHQFVSDSVLKTAISDIRTVLGDDPRQPRYIETVSRRGYRFVATTLPKTARASSSATYEAPEVSAFVGRADAVARLQHLWDRARGGLRTFVWVAGEPGIGKTTLIDHFVASLRDLVIARGQCVEHYGEGEPYLPIHEAVGDLARADTTLAGLLRAVAPTWLMQLPWLSTAEEREALRRELVGVHADRMLREFGELLDRYTEHRPLLLVTEDLHWSDRATIRLIDYLARRRGSARLMWLSSFRLAEVVALDHPVSSLRRELKLHGRCEEIILDPFSEAEVAEYLARRWPSVAGDEAFVRSLHARTDGVPLFVDSVMTDASQSLDEVTSDAVLDLDTSVPQNLASLIDHYIARLDDEHRRLLTVATVCGFQFRVPTLAMALKCDTGYAGQLCAELARGQLWLLAHAPDETADEPPYAFRHALFQQVLYERTSATLRIELHRRVGEALECERSAGAPIGPGELAMHFERGGAALAALRYYAEAAQNALMQLAPGDCMSLTERALRLLDRLPPGADRSDLELRLGTLRGLAAFQLLGVGTEATDSFRRAFQALGGVPAHPMRGLLLQNYGFVLCLRADYLEALNLAQEAAALPGASEDVLLQLAICTIRGEVHLLQGQPAAACAVIQGTLPAIEHADVGPDQGFAQVVLLGLLALELLQLGFAEQSRDRIRNAHAHAARLGQPMGHLVAFWFDALCEVRLADAERVAALADEMLSLVDVHGLAHGRAAARWFRGWAAARRGDPEQGHRQIAEACEENRRLGMLAGSSESLGYAAEALALAGQWDAAQQQLEAALRSAEACKERVYLPQLLLIEAAIAQGRGQRAAAADSLRRSVATARAQGARWVELQAVTELCETGLAVAKERAALVELLEQLPECRHTQLFDRARAAAQRPSRAGSRRSRS